MKYSFTVIISILLLGCDDGYIKTNPDQWLIAKQQGGILFDTGQLPKDQSLAIIKDTTSLTNQEKAVLSKHINRVHDTHMIVLKYSYLGITYLEIDSFNPVEMMKGKDGNIYTVRRGGYRVIFEVEPDQNLPRLTVRMWYER